jgi:Tn3 transposase DDE domain
LQLTVRSTATHEERDPRLVRQAWIDDRTEADGRLRGCRLGHQIRGFADLAEHQVGAAGDVEQHTPGVFQAIVQQRAGDRPVGRVRRIDLPDALLEIHVRTGFADEFLHISDTAARVADLPISVCAVLLTEACNIGLEPLVRRDVPALTYGRLRWVQQNYFRAETISRAARLGRRCLASDISPVAVQLARARVAAAA